MNNRGWKKLYGTEMNKGEWIEKLWLRLKEKPLEEEHSIRQIFYRFFPEIRRFVPEEYEQKYEYWADMFYSDLITGLSWLWWEDKVSYREMKIFDGSGASMWIWQQGVIPMDPAERWVEYPIEVWVENDATYNSVRSLFEYPNHQFRLTCLSQKGFAKRQQIEKLMLDRIEDVDVILNLTDFDPSGYYMPIELQETFTHFKEKFGKEVKVEHIGILPKHIPKSRRVKMKVAGKFAAGKDIWIEKFGRCQDCYEIQALMPQEIRTLVSEAIEVTVKKYNFQKRDGPK